MPRKDLAQFRRESAAIWLLRNPVLAEGEPGVELDTKQLKIGDGVTAWNQLAYVGTGTGGGTSLTPITYSTVIPLENPDGYEMGVKVLTANSTFTVGLNPILNGNCNVTIVPGSYTVSFSGITLKGDAIDDGTYAYQVSFVYRESAYAYVGKGAVYVPPVIPDPGGGSETIPNNYVSPGYVNDGYVDNSAVTIPPVTNNYVDTGYVDANYVN